MLYVGVGKPVNDPAKLKERWRTVSTPLLIYRRTRWSLNLTGFPDFDALSGVLRGGLSDLVQHILGDGVGEGGGHGQQVRVRLVTLLVSHKFDVDRGSVRGGVAVAERSPGDLADTGMRTQNYLRTWNSKYILPFMLTLNSKK
ncbi:hypothetical protein E2C01_016883 [Portunus trituberculatus]|uniref:Uncharacterized protein n=1 Tax=Portunus trituberculatus TaxID=210409 RepID=A0A5B7DQY4_PORTR|nr:hypothetical protein [Portunus trituberculatus]